MLDKIFSSFGTILKFFGVMIGLIVVAAIIMAFYATSQAGHNNRKPEVQSISQNTNPKTEAPKAPSEAEALSGQLKLNITGIEGRGFNQIANAFSEAVMTLEINNTSGKTLKGFSGIISIRDAFGDVVKSADYKNDDDIPPGVISKKITLPLNVFDQAGQRLVALKKFSTEFKVEKILTE